MGNRDMRASGTLLIMNFGFMKFRAVPKWQISASTGGPPFLRKHSAMKMR